MTLHSPASPKNVCEELLMEEKRHNAEHHILPSESAVADRLLARGLEMTPAYEELHSKLHQHPHALKTCLGLVLTAAALWNPEKIAEARNARSELTKVNQQIAKQAAELGNTKQLGIAIYTHYLFPLQIAAVLLLVAIIAAIALTLRQRKDSKSQDPSQQVKAKKADRLRIIKMDPVRPVTAAAATAVAPKGQA